MHTCVQVLGGPLCQYEEDLEPYLETIKRVYKSLLRYYYLCRMRVTMIVPNCNDIIWRGTKLLVLGMKRGIGVILQGRSSDRSFLLLYASGGRFK